MIGDQQGGQRASSKELGWGGLPDAQGGVGGPNEELGFHSEHEKRLCWWLVRSSLSLVIVKSKFKHRPKRGDGLRDPARHPEPAPVITSILPV